MADLNSHPPHILLARSHLSPALVGGRGRTASPAANIIDTTFASTASVSAQQQPAAAPGGDDDGTSSTTTHPSASPWPKLSLDSGATCHMLGDARLLCNLRDLPAGRVVRVADGNTLPITKIGDIEMRTTATAAAGVLTIPDVRLVPGLKTNLISVRQLTRSGIRTSFEGDRATMYAAGDELVGVAVAPREDLTALYELEFLSVPKTAAAAAASSGNDRLDEKKISCTKKQEPEPKTEKPTSPEKRLLDYLRRLRPRGPKKSQSESSLDYLARLRPRLQGKANVEAA